MLNLSVIFPLISLRDIVNINKLTLILKNIGQCDVKHDITDKNIGQCDVKHDVTDKNNNVSVEGLDMHYQKYHGFLYQTL